MIPRFKPWLGLAELRALVWPGQGNVERFERNFAREFHAVDAVAFPYGRSAQWAFFRALEIEGGEIILPAYTCSVVAHAVTLSGNHPVFADIRLDDFNMDLDLIPALFTERTRALIATHTFGHPQDLDRLEAMVRDAEAQFGHKVWLIQDCCHAFSATWNGRLVGSSGDVAVYAFNVSKMFTSIFGGMLTFRDQALADRIRAWRNAHYHKPSPMKTWQRRLYLFAIWLAFHDWIYGFTWWLQERTPLLDRLTKAYHLDEKVHFPSDYLDQMSEVEAAVGVAQLKRYPEIIARRQANALWYDQHAARRKGWLFPPQQTGATYSHYVVRVPDRTPALAELAGRGIHAGSLIQYSIPALACYGGRGEGYPRAELASRTTINLPVSSPLSAKLRHAFEGDAAQSPGPVWASLCAQYPGHSLLNEVDFIAIVSAAYGCQPVHVCGPNFGVPCFKVSHSIFGKKFTTHPFNFYPELLGPIAETDALLLLVDAAKREGSGWFVEYKTFAQLPLAFMEANEIRCLEPSLVSILDLQADAESQNKGYAKSLRQNLRTTVRRAERLMIAYGFSDDLRDLGAWYHLHVKLYRDKHQMIAQPLSLFVQLFSRYSREGKVRLFTAKREGQLLGGLLLLCREGHWDYCWSAYGSEWSDLGLNTLLVDQVIKAAILEGVTTLSFGSTSAGDEKLRHFKTRWGCREQQIRYYYWNHVPKDLNLKSAFRGPRRLFGLVPLGILKVLSEVFVKRLA